MALGPNLCGSQYLPVFPDAGYFLMPLGKLPLPKPLPLLLGARFVVYMAQKGMSRDAVSYTHLTLPTKA